MELPTSETEKTDGRAPSKIPPVSKNTSPLKPGASRINKTVSSQSKIPKRDVGSSSLIRRSSVITSKPALKTKEIDTKKSSKSLVSLIPPKSPRAHSLASTKSNINTTHRTELAVKSREITPRSQASTQSTDKSQKAADRVTAKKNVLAFNNIKEKVRSYQTEFMRKWEVVKDDLPQEEGEYKLIGLIKSNEGHLVARNSPKIKVKAAPKKLEDFKKELQNYVQNNLNLILDSLDQLKTSSSGKIGDTSVRGLECQSNIEDIKKKIKTDNSNALGDVLKLIESFEASESKPSEPPMNSDLEAKVTKLLKEVDELRKNLDQSQKELSRIKKSDEDKGSSYKKELEEKDKKLTKKQQELDELKKKLENLEKDGSKEKSNNRELQEKFNSKSNEVDELKKKLKSCAQSNAAQQTKNQEHETMIKKLEADLNAALKDVEKRARVEHTIGDQATKHADEIRTLKGDLANTKKERERLEKELQCLRKDNEKYSELNGQLILYRDKAKQAEMEIHSLRQNIKELEAKLQNVQSEACVSRDVHEELRRLQNVDAEKSQKIEVLEMELTKAHFQNQKLEEKIVMDRKLLKVRCSLIESLQTKENTQKIHLEDLFAEVGERNNDIQMLKTELLTKTEEFQNLFSTLGTKQLELTRQEHMIKLLQESNERAQTLRVKQEAKIGRLEEEVAQLKQTIALYQDAVLPNNALRKNLLMAEASRDNEINDNLGYYVDERRRKRHIDINVKKYEK